MQILISDAILADSAQWPDLESLLDCARRNRCYVDAVNPAASLENPWFAQTDLRRQQDWLNATSWAAKDAALYRLRTMVADVVDDPAAKPLPKITLPDAIDLVNFPATLWVENDRNDRRFLLSMMPAEQRAMFLEWETSKIFKFDSRGGLGELRVALEEFTDRGSLDPRTNRALFDSDGEVPGHRGDLAQLMITFCEKTHLNYHYLVRRAIENYIPRKALWSWALHTDSKTQAVRRRKIEAFDRMNEDQRHHFRMKTGWDKQPSAAVVALFADVSNEDRSTLLKGIDANIASVYDTFKDTIYGWANKEGIDQGVRATIDDLMDWIRVPYA